MENIASRIIEKIGNEQAVAVICGCDVSNVYRWTYPKDRGGTGGIVPGPRQRQLLNWSRENDGPLLPEDFF